MKKSVETLPTVTSTFIHFIRPSVSIQPVICQLTLCVVLQSFNQCYPRVFRWTRRVCVANLRVPSLSSALPPRSSSLHFEAGAGLMTPRCHMSNLITCWVVWHFIRRLLATASTSGFRFTVVFEFMVVVLKTRGRGSHIFLSLLTSPNTSHRHSHNSKGLRESRCSHCVRPSAELIRICRLA